jgi:hypothetical protein
MLEATFFRKAVFLWSGKYGVIEKRWTGFETAIT